MLGADEYSYLRVEITAPSNALLTEGFFARYQGAFERASAADDVAAFSDPPPITILNGIVDGSYFHTFFGYEGYLPVDLAGDFLLCAAKDATYSAHLRLVAVDDSTVVPEYAAVLLNSRERMSYDLPTDTFYYGTKAINFPRDEEFHLAFEYGGDFTYFGPDHFQIVSSSGVLADFTIVTVPEPATAGMFLAAAACLVARRRRVG